MFHFYPDHNQFLYLVNNHRIQKNCQRLGQTPRVITDINNVTTKEKEKQ